MAITLKSFAQMVTSQVVQVQSKLRSTADANAIVDMSVGSVFRALLEANAALGQWMQAQVLEILRRTRAATSEGAHLDSWMADFSLPRVAGTKASGIVSFYRLNAVNASIVALVPVGTVVEATDGSVGYEVIAGTVADTLFDSVNQRWRVLSGSLNTNIAVRALTAGTAGNLAAYQITKLTAAIPFLDGVANPYALFGGSDTETDEAFRERFQLFVASRARCTKDAIAYAVQEVGSGLRHTITENQTAAGALAPGHFSVIVDDGSDATSPATLTAVAANIRNYRPIGTTFTVAAPEIVRDQIQVYFRVETAAYDMATVTAAVVAAIIALVDSLRVGQDLLGSTLIQTVLASHAGVINVTTIRIGLGSSLGNKLIEPHQMMRTATNVDKVWAVGTQGVRE